MSYSAALVLLKFELSRSGKGFVFKSCKETGQEGAMIFNDCSHTTLINPANLKMNYTEGGGSSKVVPQ